MKANIKITKESEYLLDIKQVIDKKIEKVDEDAWIRGASDKLNEKEFWEAVDIILELLKYPIRKRKAFKKQAAKKLNFEGYNFKLR